MGSSEFSGLLLSLFPIMVGINTWSCSKKHFKPVHVSFPHVNRFLSNVQLAYYASTVIEIDFQVFRSRLPGTGVRGCSGSLPVVLIDLELAEALPLEFEDCRESEGFYREGDHKALHCGSSQE